MSKKIQPASPQLEAAWERWQAAQVKVPATRKKGPRTVLTDEERKRRRAEYLAGYYARKSQYFAEIAQGKKDHV